MSKDELINHIYGMVKDADSETLEQFYWFLMMELET